MKTLKWVVYFTAISFFLISSGRIFAAQSAPSSTSLSAATSCGQPDDGLVHIPSNYNGFTAPGEGQTYVDAQYGCAVTRLTDSVHDVPSVPRHHYYSTLTPFNAGSTAVMIFLDNGANEIRDIHGRILVPVANMPNSNTGDEPWDPIDPNVFYYASGNQFLRGTISGQTVVSTVLYTFSAYSQIIVPDEEDLSDDGTKIWLIGNPGNECAGTAILYNLATHTAISQALTLNSCHKIQVFPSGKMLCTNCNGNNITIYNTDGSIYWNPAYPYTAHAEVGTDLQGREVLIHTANGAMSLNACADPWNSLTVVDINAKAPVNCLISGIPPWHVSYRDSSSGWVALSFFDQGTCPDYSCFYPQNLVSNWQTLWAHYTEEVILVKIDGSQIQRLAHHRSRSAEYYWAQSHAAISRDGKYVLFDSNMDISNSGFTSPNQYSDVYLIPSLALAATPLAISPASVTVTAGGSQTFSTNGGTSPYTYSILSNNSGGTINASTGAYTAGSKGGVIDTVRVTDSVGSASNAAVTVQASLAISPASISVAAGGSQTFSASGGAPPYTYRILTNNSGGTINASTGVYTAGSKGGVIDTVRVTDSVGSTSNAAVTVGTNACATIAKVQVISPGFVSATKKSASITETAGNLLVAAVYWNGADTVSISDKLGNTWNSLPVQNNNVSATDVRIWYAQNIKGGANTVTVTQPWPVAIGFYLIEYSGIAITNALDASTGKIAPSVSHFIDTGNMTTTGCRDLVVGLFADSWGSGAMTVGPGWTSRGTDSNFYSMIVDNAPGATGTFDPRAQLAGSNSDAAWSATAAAFKAKQ